MLCSFSHPLRGRRCLVHPQMSNAEEFRFLQDAEFAQALLNVDYVLWLSKQGFFEKQDFLNYLRYLDYLTLPEYAMHLTYPKALQMLDFLRNDAIRTLLAEDPLTFRRILMDQLWSSWGRKAESSDSSAQVIST